MNPHIILSFFMVLVLLYFAPQISAQANNEDICPFEQTVNLTNCERLDDGSYRYDDIIIPPEKQDFYDYQLRFLAMRETVPRHLRGCACDKIPCIKLCCPRNEFLNDTNGQCDKINPEMKISWDVRIILESGAYKTVNLLDKFTSQIGLPCDMPESFDYVQDVWILKQNGEIFVESDDSVLNTLNYCYSPYAENFTDGYLVTPFSCPIKQEADWDFYLNAYAMALSVFFLIPTILVYLVLKELRNNLRGKLLISYLVSLTMGYAILSFEIISGTQFSFISCSILGYTCYFFFMAAFLWLSVLCFDIWINFKETNTELCSRKNRKHFIIYSLYAWLSAGLATLTIILIQNSKRIDDIYKPGIGVNYCWLNTNRWSATYYFYGPNLIILLFNFITFTRLTVQIYNIRHNLARMTRKERFFQENAVVILRLFLIMGISWLFDIVSYCLRNYEEWNFVFYLSDFANAIQGLLIFILFVLKKNVLSLIKNRNTGKPRKNVTASNTTFSKLQSISSVQPITP